MLPCNRITVQGKNRQREKQFTHGAPKQVLEEDEKEMDLNNLCAYNHHQFAIVYSDHMHLSRQLSLQNKQKIHIQMARKFALSEP